MVADETKCVNCQRCVVLCPTRALKIVKSDATFRENANWKNDTIKEISNRLKAEECCFLLWGIQIHCRYIGIRY